MSFATMPAKVQKLVGGNGENHLADGMAAVFRLLGNRSFGALIVALCVMGGARDLRAETAAEDLAGRWTSQRHGYVLDMVRCGTEWCGIKLNPDQSCGAVALRLTQDSAMDTWQRGLVGSLVLDPATRTYKVRATAGPDGAARPKEIHLSGNPDMVPAIFTRSIQFRDLLVRGPEATCTAERKMS